MDENTDPQVSGYDAPREDPSDEAVQAAHDEFEQADPQDEEDDAPEGDDENDEEASS